LKDFIIAELHESIEVKKQASKQLVPQIEAAARLMISALKAGNKILIFGNGGSAADSQHLAAELIGRYRKDRRSLPAIALTTDTSIITSISNDYSYEVVFSKQVEGLARKGDVAVGLSTSGNSRNVLVALEKAKELGCATIGFLGGDGGQITEAVDVPITIPSKITARVQESHITIGHIICGLIENELFGRE